MLRAIVVAVLLIIADWTAIADSLAFEGQRQAILFKLARYGIVPGFVFEAGGTFYVVKEINVTFNRSGAPSIELKNDVLR